MQITNKKCESSFKEQICKILTYEYKYLNEFNLSFLLYF